ncbi:WXG100 family type VII secretion target [Rhodococcus sp. NPDC078407]|uniref:WXG100 family type VII secretion target n=1 Tax=Rhodococcus sp. NPDC078407 TaxID=3364509 RepID=UPI0037C86F06
MPIDTKVDGSVTSVHAVAGWLRNSFAADLSTSIDTLDSTRNRTEAGWDGPASEAFFAQALATTDGASQLATAAADYADKVDAFAVALQALHDGMRDIRSDAIDVGLDVIDDAIIEPIDDALRDKFDAFERRVAHLRGDETAAGEQLKVDYIDAAAKTFFFGGSVAIGLAQAAMETRAWLMTSKADEMYARAVHWAEFARTAPAGSPFSAVYRDFGFSDLLRNQADDMVRNADDLNSKAGKWGLRAGGGLAVLSIGYDIANGKPVDQAVVAGGLGFGAAVAAGALIGTALPIPGFGTAVGAIGGAFVGIFTSGIVDGLYEDGFDSVRGAITDGVDAVGATVEAGSDLATGVWDAIF